MSIMTADQIIIHFEQLADAARAEQIRLDEDGGMGQSFGAALARERADTLIEVVTFLREHSTLRWTTTPPTTVGYYWCRSYGQRIEYVEDHGGELWIAPHHPDGRPVAMFSGCEWAGPLPEPVEESRQ